MNILDSSWLFAISIESMGEFCAGMKVVYSIFNRKTHIGLKRGEHPRYTTIQDFPYVFIPFTWINFNLCL